MNSKPNRCVPVTECKSMCLTHSESKQHKTSELGAEKDLLQGQGDRWLMPLNSKTPGGFQQSTSKGKVEGESGQLW